MPISSPKPPKYGLHRPSGQAVVYLSGKAHYLGKHGSPESHEKYARLLAERAQKSQTPAKLPPGEALSVNQVLLAYFQFAKTYYIDGTGNTTHEFDNLRYAAKPLRALYGSTPVAEFGPKRLKTLRQHLVDEGRLCRRMINRRVNQIKRIIKWAVSEELAPAGTYEALRAVEPLKQGRTTAREKPTVKPAPQEHIDAVLDEASPQLAAMIRLQYLGGMRPQDIVQMRPCDIEQTGDVWTYRPEQHKNKWREETREVFIGPQAQEILKPFLDRGREEYLFSPIEGEAWRNAQRRKKRLTPMTPSQAKRRPKKRPKRPNRDHYDRHSYNQAIGYTVNKVNRQRQQQGLEPIPKWCPLQLRHSRATELRRRFDLQASQVVLGHKNMRTTEIYAEQNKELARRIQRELG